jgi:predicted nucleic acid-binding protein
VIIVSNTGPLIGLAKIQQLGLLGRLAAEVYIPPQVQIELLARTGPETALIAQPLPPCWGLFVA